MTLTIKVPLYLSLSAFLLIAACNFNHDKAQQTQQGEEKIDLQCFQTEIGWGYKILVNNKTYINQPFIPVIPERKGFATREMAEKTGQIVVEKLKNHEKPIITVDDLKKCNVLK
jgi:hypothetical protein